MRLKMGTRGSALALAQSGWVAVWLKRLRPDLEIETVVIKTSGDVFALQPPKTASELAESTKGLFVKEIEEALARREIDFAVHSAKDLPGCLLEGLAIAAYPPREDPRDVLVAKGGAGWGRLPSGARVATSSLRRKYQLLSKSPGAEVIGMRGNVDTRLRKLSEGACDALLLAAAGLKRLGRSDVRAEPIPVSEMLPAPGQGALAIETRQGAGAAAELISRLDDPQTRLAVEFERAFLAAMGGGCTTPLAALARPEAGRVELSVFWARQDGTGAVRLSDTCRDLSERDRFAAALAARVRASG